MKIRIPEKNNLFETLVGPPKNGVKKMFGIKKNIESKKDFGLQKTLGPKNILCPKKILGPNVFRFKTNFGTEKIWGQKKFVQTNF